jgi:hypothetical protein
VVGVAASPAVAGGGAGAGVVRLERFEQLMLRVMVERLYEPDSEEMILQAFKVLDPEHRGYIDEATLHELLTGNEWASVQSHDSCCASMLAGVADISCVFSISVRPAVSATRSGRTLHELQRIPIPTTSTTKSALGCNREQSVAIASKLQSAGKLTALACLCSVAFSSCRTTSRCCRARTAPVLASDVHFHPMFTFC